MSTRTVLPESPSGRTKGFEGQYWLTTRSTAPAELRKRPIGVVLDDPDVQGGMPGAELGHRGGDQSTYRSGERGDREIPVHRSTVLLDLRTCAFDRRQDLLCVACEQPAGVG